MIVSRPNVPAYETIPDGLQDALLIEIFDLGYQASFPGERPKPKIVILWELGAKRANGDRFTIWKEYTATLADTAYLRVLLESWRGEPLSEAELAGFDLGVLKDKHCTLEIARKLGRTGRSTYADVVAVFRPRKSCRPWKRETPLTFIPELVAQKMSEAIPATSVDPDFSDFSDEAQF